MPNASSSAASLWDPAALDARITLTRLRNWLRVNAVFSTVSGAIVVALGTMIAGLVGVEEVAGIRAGGILLVVYGAGLFAVATARPDRLRAGATMAVAADAAWVLASAGAIAFVDRVGGRTLVVGLAAPVAFLAISQARALQATRIGTDPADDAGTAIEALRVETVSNQDPAALWSAVADHQLFGRLALNLHRVEVVEGSGEGMVRRCDAKGGRSWTESCSIWEPGRRHAVEVDTSHYPYPPPDRRMPLLHRTARPRCGTQPRGACLPNATRGRLQRSGRPRGVIGRTPPPSTDRCRLDHGRRVVVGVDLACVMKVGVMIFATDQTVPLHVLAPAVEALGFESLWVTEKTHVPTSRRTPWPGGDLPDAYRRTCDPLIALTAAAAVTTRLRLGTGILLAALRDPVILAKEIATLDWLSDGRFEFGVGYGWNAEECATHGVELHDAPDVLVDHLGLMQSIWTNDVARYEGPHCRLDPSWSWPKPVQIPGPPIHFGGRASARLFADAASHGDGWIPIEGYGDILPAIAPLRNAFEKAGREPSTATVTVFSSSGNPEALHRYAHAGIDRVVISLPSIDAPGISDALATHAADCAPWLQRP